jgi:excisionase family DNA binding protein
MDKPVFTFDVNIPESVYKEFETRLIEIADRVFGDRVKTVREQQLTRQEAAQKLRISLTTLDKLKNTGVLKFSRSGKKILFSESEITRFLNVK